MKDRIRGRARRTFASTCCFWALSFLSITPARSQQSLPDDQLRIEALRGADAVHPAREPSGVVLEVAVFDERDRPLPGVTVTFLAPQKGASARFLNDSTMAAALTDERGIAQIPGLRGNHVAGTYQVHVTASFAGKTGSMNLTHTNHKSPLVTRKRAIIAGAVAAAALPLALRLSSSQPKATISAVISSGVGAP